MAKARFEWDPKKDEDNQAKHGISFGTAQFAFADPRRVIAEDPVSYTHLRAHETVLDTVCRLLLEKKNNRSTNQTITRYNRELTDICARH